MSQPPGDADNQPTDAPDQPTEPTRPLGGEVPPPGYGPPGYGGSGYAAPGYGAPAYGSMPPAPGQPPVAPYQFVPPPTHGRGLASMILGIVSLVLCFGYGLGLLGSPVAWWLGAKSLKEIDAAPGQYSGRGFAQTGQILGIVGTVLLGLFLLAVLVILVIVVVVNADSSATRIPAESL